jgi:hypothetical protein
MLPASAVPINVGVFTKVMLSLLEAPESLLVIKSGVDGAVGIAVSMATLYALDEVLRLPAASVAVAVKL